MGNIQSDSLPESRHFKRYRFFAKNKVADAASVHSTTSEPNEPNGAVSLPNFRHIGGRTYNLAENSIYLLPNDPKEADRLHEQHYMIKYLFEGNYEPCLKKALQSIGTRVLDVACGSATWMLDMATDHPHVEFFGIDISPIFPSEIKPPNTIFAVANVLEGIPYPDNHFDIVNMRMVTGCWHDKYWPWVIQEMYRVVKPGGYIQLLEPDHTFWVIEPERQQVWKKWNAWQMNRGCNTKIARSIHKMIQTAGFVNIQKRYMSAPLNWGGHIGQLCNDTWLGLMMASAPRVADKIGYTEAEFEWECKEIAEYSKDVNEYINFHIAIGRKPLLLSVMEAA